MMISTSDSIIRLIVAIILGGLIGYEREARSQSAGLRTHILVCLGACLCMIISINIALDFYSVYGYTRSDPERIAAQVISGVGFLGAGTILANQKGHSVKGLTTAASIWGVAAVGLVVGAGYLVTAAAATVLIFIVLTVFVRLDKMMRKRGRHSYVLHLTMRNTVGQSRRLSEYLQHHQLTLLSFRTLSRTGIDGTRRRRTESERTPFRPSGNKRNKTGHRNRTKRTERKRLNCIKIYVNRALRGIIKRNHCFFALEGVLLCQHVWRLPAGKGKK